MLTNEMLLIVHCNSVGLVNVEMYSVMNGD